MLFLDGVSAGSRHPSFRTIRLHVILDPCGLTGLWVYQLNIRNIDERFLLDDPATTVTLGICFLMALDNPGSFNLDLSLNGSHFQDSPTLTFVTAGDDLNLIVFLNL